MSKTRANDEWHTQCPVHDDNHRSLVIKCINGRLLFHCVGGCSVADIMQAITKNADWVADYGTQNEKGGRIKFSFFNMDEAEAKRLADRLVACLEAENL